MFKHLRNDIAVALEKDPAAKSKIEVFLTYSGVKALFYYRMAHALHKRNFRLLARMLSQRAKRITGIEIHPGATIGERVFIDHGAGVVIGETTEIGDNVTIYQGVTLGGTGKDTGKRHPTIGRNVLIGSGAKVLGPFKVGDNARIAAGAVVLNEVPENATAVGVPARIVRIAGQKPTCELDQIHYTDPVSQELCRLQAEIDVLQKELDEKNK